MTSHLRFALATKVGRRDQVKKKMVKAVDSKNTQTGKHTTLQMSGKKMRSFSSSSSNNNSYYNNNKIIDVLGGGGVVTGDGHYNVRNCGGRSKEVLKKMQKAGLSGTLNIARTFKVVT